MSDGVTVNELRAQWTLGLLQGMVAYHFELRGSRGRTYRGDVLAGSLEIWRLLWTSRVWKPTSHRMQTYHEEAAEETRIQWCVRPLSPLKIRLLLRLGSDFPVACQGPEVENTISILSEVRLESECRDDPAVPFWEQNAAPANTQA